jgi:hypothetical protein
MHFRVSRRSSHVRAIECPENFVLLGNLAYESTSSFQRFAVSSVEVYWDPDQEGRLT